MFFILTPQQGGCVDIKNPTDAGHVMAKTQAA